VVSGVREQPIHAEPDEASTVDLSMPRGVRAATAQAPELTVSKWVFVGSALIFTAREWQEVLEHF
jgi:hypothetical protein